MRFTYQGQEFTGPDTREGLLGGFTVGERRWARQALKLPSADEMDVGDARLLFYFLTIRRSDHRLLPPEKFDELTLLDFELVRHVVTELDADGDCAECHRPVDAALHLPAEDGAEPDPTSRPSSGADGPTPT